MAVMHGSVTKSLPCFDDLLSRSLFSTQIDDGGFLGQAHFLDEFVKFRVNRHLNALFNRPLRSSVNEGHRCRKNQSLATLFLLNIEYSIASFNDIIVHYIVNCFTTHESQKARRVSSIQIDYGQTRNSMLPFSCDE